MSAESDFLQFQFQAVFLSEKPGKIGIACSGGGDSVALLRVAADYGRDTDTEVAVVTVDHGLRAGSYAEAQFVGEICAGLGLDHTILRWQDWNGEGNLQNEARRARYTLIADWAHARGVDVVCLGHTADDQAETVLMQIARSAGTDGLAAMPARRGRYGVTWLRPFLQTRRAALRGYLTELGQDWIDDPSNEDTAFDRIKARNVLEALAPLGISAEKLCTLASNMADARNALRQQVWHFAGDVALVQDGDVLLHRDNLLRGHFEIRRRLLRHALMWVASSEYGPRRSELTNLFKAIQEGRAATLAGCLISPDGDRVRITREYRAVAGLNASPEELWDARWRLVPTDMSGATATSGTVRALGESGLKMCPDWRETGLPRATLLASPALFLGDALVAAPLAGYSQGWQAELACGEKDFFASLVSH